MDKKIILLIIIFISIGCKKQCSDNTEIPLPLPSPYNIWFENIKNKTVNYIVHSSDNLYQSFNINTYKSQVYYLKPTHNTGCDYYIGESVNSTLNASIYPFAINYGIRHKDIVNNIECFLNFSFYDMNTSKYYYEDFSKILTNLNDSGSYHFYNYSLTTIDTIINGRINKLDNYNNCNGLNFTDLYRIDLVGGRFINNTDYPLYILLSTKYGLIEYKEKSGRIWSVSKL